MPFVTEELWQRLPKPAEPQPDSVMLAAYPAPQAHWQAPELEREMDFLLEAVRAARILRAGTALNSILSQLVGYVLVSWPEFQS